MGRRRAGDDSPWCMVALAEGFEMQTQLGSGLVRELMVQLAEEDARRRSVNSVLYARSATYQQTLDGLLGDMGSYVSQAGAQQYRVRARPV